MSGFSALDHAMMARALRLAARGVFTTHPNPHVGCVITRDGKIVGEGWHQRAGESHAEVFALRAAGDAARGATAYVTLEPCSHQGRTPPCADALVRAGVARVVAAADDPNPKAGGGLARLRAAGIVAEAGLLRALARELNRGFFSRFERGRPWVRVKLAMSLDGRTALSNGAARWITGDAARADVQRWRARSSAILTGAGTVRADDPRLTVRLPATPGAPAFGPVPAREALQPLRVVLDTHLDALRARMNLLDGGASTLVIHAPGAKFVDKCYMDVELAEVAADATGHLDLAAVLQLLARRGVNEVQVEAGPTLCGALFGQGLVDELLLYVAPVLLGDTARPLLALPALADMTARWKLRLVDLRRVGGDSRWLLRPA
ncbi:MAG TPA: bifunctional diaminohydroxyphosphoribosylaminopyrimidine deaminase/5-amino-6-(5-phosphoribosylamino)uracil reductase RibD [Rhodanobacteraceae bacterium]|nr:bifunctional diaminohydroxyphosphoribosylaminopyrimidine deaminase/5-amino-6-(5-phosphoribosylamino)uracil reductase RibD [Rhodanobacteraceae bacterium]